MEQHGLAPGSGLALGHQSLKWARSLSFSVSFCAVPETFGLTNIYRVDVHHGGTNTFDLVERIVVWYNDSK